MAKLCPKCKARNVEPALSCQCGFLFVEDIEAQRSSEAVLVRHYRRNRTIKKTVVVFGAIGLILAVAAYFGGFLRGGENADDQDLRRSLVEKGASDTNQPILSETRFPIDGAAYRVIAAFTGSVIGVIDANNREHRVAIFGIRAPKLNESFGPESKQNLSTLVLGKSVIIKLRKSEENADIVAEILSGNSNIGLEQVQAGFAWLIADELNGLSEVERQPYMGADTTAKNGRFGVWSGQKGVNPPTSEIAGVTAPVTEPNGLPLKKDESQKGGISPWLTRKESPERAKLGRSERNPKDVFEQGTQPVSLVSTVARPVSNPTAAKAGNEPKPTVPANALDTPSSGRKYILGPRGGCYYLNAKGNKSYVDRSSCN